jgi:hypothetical protein
MLRQWARDLRRSLLVLGVALLAWLPASYLLYCGLTVPLPTMYGGELSLDRGVAKLRITDSVPSCPNERARSEFEWEWVADRREPAGRHFSFHRGAAPWPFTSGSLPLWLLSAACLAWPVTSFALARRGRNRGPAVTDSAQSL